MAANPRDVARNLFLYARGDAKRVGDIRNAFELAMTGALTKGGMDSLTNATKNNVSMSKLVGLNESDRQTALRLAIEWIDAGFVPSQSRGFARF